jgi:hypothetical protein
VSTPDTSAPTAAELADFRAWKESQQEEVVGEISLRDVLCALVHSARLPSETIVRQYIEAIDKAFAEGATND